MKFSDVPKGSKFRFGDLTLIRVGSMALDPMTGDEVEGIEDDTEVESLSASVGRKPKPSLNQSILDDVLEMIEERKEEIKTLGSSWVQEGRQIRNEGQKEKFLDKAKKRLSAIDDLFIKKEKGTKTKSAQEPDQKVLGVLKKSVKTEADFKKNRTSLIKSLGLDEIKTPKPLDLKKDDDFFSAVHFRVYGGLPRGKVKAGSSRAKQVSAKLAKDVGISA